MNYSTLSKKLNKFYRFTGITLDIFQKLAQEVEPLWHAAEHKRLSRPNRQRAIGAGGKYKLVDFLDKLLVIFMYYRL